MIELRTPSLILLNSYLESVEEMRQLGETIWEGMMSPKAGETHSDFINRVNLAPTNPEPGLVPENVYWGVYLDQVVGRIALRHQLTDKLREFGGNIGYEVRPSFRRQGVASEMLRLLLLTPKARELGRILITCSPDNIGSNNAIIKNHGKLERTSYVERYNRDTNYYWIDLSLEQ